MNHQKWLAIVHVVDPGEDLPDFHTHDELSVQDGLVYRGERLIIPCSLMLQYYNLTTFGGTAHVLMQHPPYKSAI